jgi:hypothetical protein
VFDLGIGECNSDFDAALGFQHIGYNKLDWVLQL